MLTYISGCHIKHGRDRWKTSLGLDFVRYTLFFSERFTNISFSILEGLITVVAGIASFWIIQDFPDTAKFLSEEERTVVVRRLQGDDQFSAAGEKLKMKYIVQSLVDWKTYVGSKPLSRPTTLGLIASAIVVIYAGCDMPLYAFSLFLPTIINQASVF